MPQITQQTCNLVIRINIATESKIIMSDGLCNACRIKLGASTESALWIYENCINKHEEEK